MKQSTNLDFLSKVEKMFYSHNTQDRYLALELLAGYYNLNLRNLVPSILYYQDCKKVILLKDTSDNQLEIVLGKTGITVRDISQVTNSLCITYWI